MIKAVSRLTVFAATCLVLGSTAVPVSAQFGAKPLAAPGERVARETLAREGGDAGRRLAPLVGVRPVLVVYWRPGDAQSERALLGAINAQSEGAPNVVLFPVAVLAARQSSARIRQRLRELGLDKLTMYQDSGQLALALGVRQVPAFALIDVTGVLRLVGGADISQVSVSGVSIVDALVRANRGEPVPTLGQLSSQPVYQLLGRQVPQLAVTELDGTTWRKLSEYQEPGKRLLLFYWSPTCSHCKKALPELKEWFQNEKPDDVVLVDMARADSSSLRNAGVPIIKDYPWVHLLDVDRNAGRKLLVTQTPTAYLLDPAGEVLSIQVGGDIDWGAWIGGRSARAARAQN